MCDMEIETRLQSGHFQDSFLIKFKNGPVNGHYKAIAKRCFPLSDEDVDILRRVKHKNIVQCIDYISSPWTHLRVMEMGKLTLREYMNCNNLSPELEQTLICDLFEAVKYLHGGIFTRNSPKKKQPIVHRLITATKCVLFGEGDALTLKLTDFNYCGKNRTSLWDHSVPLNLYYGAYFAPEVQINYQFSTASDIYAIGTLLWEIKTNRIPTFRDKNGEIPRCVEDIAFGQSLDEIVESTWKKLLNWCWMKNPDDRPCIQRVIDYWSSEVSV